MPNAYAFLSITIFSSICGFTRCNTTVALHSLHVFVTFLLIVWQNTVSEYECEMYILISIMQNLTVNIETYTSVTTHTTYNVLAYTDDGSEHSVIVVCV